MQLEPQVLSFMRFTAPEYQYKPQQQKLTENKYLEMYYKTNPDTCFVHLVQTLFSDRYLYEHKSFRNLVYHNKKGYVDINDIFAQDLILNFLRQMGDDRPQFKQVIHLINKLSTKLVCNRNQVRRKFPFNNKLRQSKPLYIEEYPENDGNQELQTLLDNTTTIYKIKYNHSQNWATVYAQDPDRIVKLNGKFWTIKTYFRVMTYEKAMCQFDNAFLGKSYSIIKNHGKSLFAQINKLQNQSMSMNNLNYRHPLQNNDQNNDSDHSSENQIYSEQQRQICQEKMGTSQMDFQLQRQLLRREKGIEKYNIQKNTQKKLIKQKVKFFQPNFELNCNFLSGIGSNQKKVVISGNEVNQRKISKEKQEDVDKLLMGYFKKEDVKILSRNSQVPKQLNRMQLQ